ncbi:MAG: oxygen-independent coproporphyrinogen III oxidase [Gammaproteobacteria bacterium]|nr:oxygen-independent coproporphyrinogen III oxidase [Gammaproteobacteria bacterium]
MSNSPLFDLNLIQRYDKAGPRYTSYPSAVQFNAHFLEEHYREAARLSNEELLPRALSLYFHIPFCDTICYYCGCNKVVTKDRSKAELYLQYISKEVVMQGALFDRDRVVEQLHWGGGTPTFLSHQQMRDLMAVTRENFTLRDGDGGEYSIEIDPREIQHKSIALLRELGFNRMSLGVQDFDSRVQKAVNRIQPEEMTRSTLEAARREGFKSVSMDLIYGLPLQNLESFDVTLQRVIDLDPDRLSVFNYAHLPHLFKPQRRIHAEELPTPAEKLDILQLSLERLTAAGYVYIGMDHFAKPSDELALAQNKGTLYRNFQGYSTHAECDLIGLGASSIGSVYNSYDQNVRDLDGYYAALDAGHLPLFRGYELEADDLLRREIITQIICHFCLDTNKIAQQWEIQFENYFESELAELEVMQQDGLLTLQDGFLQVESKGRLLVRNICQVFDRYNRPDAADKRFSRLI